MSFAQKKTVKLADWQVAATLPSNAMSGIGVAGPVTGYHNEIFMIAGGANFPDQMPWEGGKKIYHSDVHIYKKDDGGKLVYYKTLNLPFTLAYSANTSTEFGIISAGGENENGLTNQVFLLQWDEDTDSIQIKNLPSLPFKLTNASVAYYNGIAYVIGGEKQSETSTDCLLLDLTNSVDKWENFTPLNKPISNSVVAVSNINDNVNIYVFGGRRKNKEDVSTFYSSVYQYNIAKAEWKEKNSIPYSLAAGTGISSDDGSIIIFGGDVGEVFNKTENYLIAIHKEDDVEKKRQLELSKNQLQSAHPGFCREILSYSTQKNKWKSLGCLPFDTPVTTTAVKWDNNIFIPSGEIKAGVRTPGILSAKLVH